MGVVVREKPPRGLLAPWVVAQEKREQLQSCLSLTSNLSLSLSGTQFLLGTRGWGVKELCEDPPVPTLSALASQGASLLRFQKLFLDLEAKGFSKGEALGPPRHQRGRAKAGRSERARQGLRGLLHPFSSRSGRGPPPSYLLHTVWDLWRAGQRPRALHGQHIFQQLLTPCRQTDSTGSEPRAGPGLGQDSADYIETGPSFQDFFHSSNPNRKCTKERLPNAEGRSGGKENQGGLPGGKDIRQYSLPGSQRVQMHTFL